MATDEPPSADLSERRAALVAEREQALAKHAAELAVRERALQALERHLHERAELIAAREAAVQEAESAPAPEPEARSFEVLEGSKERAKPLPASEAQPEFEVSEGSKKEAEPLPAPEAEREAQQYSEIGLDELERLVAANRDQHPELAESWEFTLYHLREYADVDGRLPLLFDGMIDEVFGPLLDR